MATSDPPSPAVRLATSADGPACAEIFLEGRRQAFPWQPRELFGLDDYYECTRDQLVWVAESAGEVIGFVAASPTDRIVRHLFVAGRWQKQGIGRRLIDHARSRMSCGPVRLICSARNEAALAFYQRVGWIEVGVAPEDGGRIYACGL